MKNKWIQKWLKKFPDDYDVVLSGFSAYVEEGGFLVFVDNPITGVLSNDSTKEIRFMVDIRDKEILKNAYPDYKEIEDV